MTQPATARRTKAPYQWLALAIGAVYLLVGIAGFFVTGFDDFTEHDHSQTLMGFALNPLHNVVHLVIGAAGLLLWASRNGARLYGWLLGVGYGATAIYGFLVVNNPETNILNINGADNVLHVVSALAGFAVALWPDPRDGTPDRGAGQL
jgi:hypothetical protein